MVLNKETSLQPPLVLVRYCGRIVKLFNLSSWYGYYDDYLTTRTEAEE
jgi:hypothetical protein